MPSRRNSSKAQRAKKPNQPSRQRQKNVRRASSAPSTGSSLIKRGVNLVGDAAAYLFKKVTGFGDYQVSQNSLLDGNSPPMFSNGSSGRSTVIRHREYIGDISGSTNFSITKYPINPGLYSTFPWLNDVALSFEQYKLHGMVFEFKSTSASALNSTNTALGTVIMATEYDVKKPDFASKVQMENYFFASSTKPNESCLHPIECAKGEQPVDTYYIRSTSDPQVGLSQDIRFCDHGNFYLATVGMQASAVIGELWVTYEIELLKPRIGVIEAQQNTWTEDLFGAVITGGTTVTFPGPTYSSYALNDITGISTINNVIFINNPSLNGRCIEVMYSFNCGSGWSGVETVGIASVTGLVPNNIYRSGATYLEQSYAQAASDFCVMLRASYYMNSDTATIAFSSSANSIGNGSGTLTIRVVNGKNV